MRENPPVRLPGHGALLPDGTHITEAEFQAAVDRVLAFLDTAIAEFEPEDLP